MRAILYTKTVSFFCKKQSFNKTLAAHSPTAYLDFKQGDLSMRQFIAMDDKMFKEFTKALGDMSD